MGSGPITRPTPPADLDGEALLEWERIAAELEELGTLARADRAMLVVWCRTWAAHAKAAAVVAADGPVVTLPNNWPGQSAEFKTMMDTAKLLDKLAQSLGLSGKARRPEPVQQDAGGLGDY